MAMFSMLPNYFIPPPPSFRLNKLSTALFLFTTTLCSNEIVTCIPVYREGKLQDGVARQNKFEDTIYISPLLLFCQVTSITGNQAVFNNMSGLEGRRKVDLITQGRNTLF